MACYEIWMYYEIPLHYILSGWDIYLEAYLYLTEHTTTHKSLLTHIFAIQTIHLLYEGNYIWQYTCSVIVKKVCWKKLITFSNSKQ